MTVNFSIWVAILRNGTVSGDFDLLKSKLGGYAPEWVAMLRNRTVPEGYFGGKIVILGGFAPEISTVSKPPKLGGHAPEHPYCQILFILRLIFADSISNFQTILTCYQKWYRFTTYSRKSYFVVYM